MIFLDEPSNDLDLDTLLWLENYIITSPKTILFVSHDEDFLSRTATKIIHLESVKKKGLAQTKVEELDYQDYAQKRQQAYQKQVRQARNDQKEFDKALNKHLRQKSQVCNTLLNTHDATMGRLIAKKMKNVLSREKRYERMKKNLTEVPFHEDAISLFFSDISPLPARKQVLHLENFQLNVDKQQLVSNIHFNLNGQEKIGIIGQNGIGKSSFLKLIYQELRQRADINLGYMPQRYSEVLDESKTPLNFLLENGNRGQEQGMKGHQIASDDEWISTINLNLSFLSVSYLVSQESVGLSGWLHVRLNTEGSYRRNGGSLTTKNREENDGTEGSIWDVRVKN